MNTSLSTLTKIAAPLATGMFLVGFVARTEDPFASAVVDRTYESADLGKLELAGACTITPDNISCWDPDGKPAPNLSEKVQAYYIVQGGNELRLKFGRKNRLIVFKEPPRGNPNGAYLGQAKTLGGQYMNQFGTIGMGGYGNGDATTWYLTDSEPTQEKTSVVFEVNVQFGSATVPVKAGSQATLGPIKVKIESIKPGPDRKQNWGPNPAKGQKTWTVTVTLDGTIGGKYPTVNGSVIGSDGQAVWSVSASGVPTPRPKGPFFTPPMMMGGFDGNVFLASGANTAKQELSVPVDPSKAHAIVLSLGGTRQVTFQNILLDPK